MAAGAIGVHPLAKRARHEGWRVVACSALGFVLSTAGWSVAACWLLAAAVLAALRWAAPAARWAAALGLAVWGIAFLAWPQLLEASQWGWVAPVLLIGAAYYGVTGRRSGEHPLETEPGPPQRQVRGTLSLRGVVLAGCDGLPRSVPIDLELRAGDSLAVLCDVAADAEAFFAFLAGRRAALEGEMAVDGVPVAAGDRLVTVVGEGERFVAGDLDENLGVLADEAPEADARAALHESFSLAEVAQELAGRELDTDGAPLSPFHRLLVLAARVVASPYRVLVVVDPMPWVNAVRREIWRGAVVRASVGRTAVWITSDRELASRAVHLMELRHGALRR